MIKFNKSIQYIRNISKSSSIRFSSSLVQKKITDDKIGVITLNDPKRLNAMTYDLGIEFKSVIQECIKDVEDQRIRSLILTGAGKAFSAGGDLKWLEERGNAEPFNNHFTMIEYYNLFLGIKDVQVPTIAAINGAAVGAGLAVACVCDMRIAKATAQLGFPFPKLGIHPGMASSVTIERLVGHQQAFNLLISGRMISGNEAARIGLILESIDTSNGNSDYDGNKVLDRAMELAKDCAANSPGAVRATLNTLRRTKFRGLEAALEREASSQAINYYSEDFKSGLEGVATKTIPTFKGW